MFSPSRRKIDGMGEGELGLRDGTLLCTAGMHGGDDGSNGAVDQINQ